MSRIRAPRAGRANVAGRPMHPAGWRRRAGGQSLAGAASPRRRSTRGARVELALLHDERSETGAAARWLQAAPVASHHHVVDTADLGRLARLLTRRGVGLVLSGGGARGFAHLGVIRALREASVPIDFRRRLEHRLHHRRRRCDRLERRGNAAALSQKLRCHQPGERLHLPLASRSPAATRSRGCCEREYGERHDRGLAPALTFA